MKRIVILPILIFSFIDLLAQQTAIRNVNIIDVKTGKVLPDHSTLIVDGKISWIGPDKKLKPAANVTVLDGAGKYLMPGLIDSHIHFFQSGSLYTRPDGVDLTRHMPYKEERERGFQNTTDYLKRYLRLGITTVMDVGGPFSNFAIRDSVSKTIVSPNILVTGPLFSIVDRKALELNDPPIVKITSNEEAEKLFNKMLPYKPDFIKIWYIAGKNYPAEKSLPLVKYIAELSARNNLKLAVHATELETARLAVEAGANILVHSVEDEIIPAAFVKTLKDKNVTYIPTLIVGGNYGKVFAGKLPHHPQDLAWANAFAYGTLSDVEAMDSSSLPPAIKWLRKNGIPKRYTVHDSIMSVNLRKLMTAGVNVATGTDAGNIGTLHAASYIQELEAMQRAGLSNAEILKASTINAASGFGISDKIASIEKGKNADLLLLQKNPLESINNLNSIEWVVKDGKVIKADTIVSESPEAIVQRQVNAYNARNLDAFLATYADDVEIIDSKGSVVMRGHEQMRKGYTGLFTKNTDLHCEIEERIVINNKVIDKEKVRVGGKFMNGVALYEVEGGKIKKVTFIN